MYCLVAYAATTATQSPLVPKETQNYVTCNNVFVQKWS